MVASCTENCTSGLDRAQRSGHGKTVSTTSAEYFRMVTSKSERQAARARVAEYHEAQQAELVARVGDAIDRYRAGELNAFDVDQVLFQYSRAAKELWKFCNYGQVEIAAAMIGEPLATDWWERGAPRER
jgi:hypothetical protein